MALTRANVEAILIKRVGKLMTAVGLDGTTVSGTNTDLNDPIGEAIRHLGYTVASITSVADVDLLPVTIAQYSELLDVAELRTLYSIQGNYTLVDVTIGPRDERLSKLADVIEKAIARKERLTSNLYGVGLSDISVELINYKFAEHDIDNIDELGQ